MNKRFFKDVITIYNQKSDDTFQRNVLKNVYVRNDATGTFYQCDRNAASQTSSEYS